MNDFPYQDILFFSHPTSKRHPRMSMDNRAGQFAPFAALVGFEEKIDEVQRLTAKKRILDENYQEELDQKLYYIASKQFTSSIQVTYFLKDQRKEGGSYQTKSGFLKNIDFSSRQIVFQDKVKIRIEDIVNIEILDLSNKDNLL